MKVLLVNGSPHEHGCTDAALQQVASGLAEYRVESEILWLGNGPVYSCSACHACRKTGRCCHDDMANRIIEKMEACDGLVIGSAVHYASATGMITAVMDRVCFAGARLAGKPAAAVASARRAGTTATLDQLQKYFAISGMMTVGSQYWPMVHGQNAEQARQDLEGMQTMRLLGRNMGWLLQCMAAGDRAGVIRPVREPGVSTNFIR